MKSIKILSSKAQITSCSWLTDRRVLYSSGTFFICYDIVAKTRIWVKNCGLRIHKIQKLRDTESAKIFCLLAGKCFVIATIADNTLCSWSQNSNNFWSFDVKLLGEDQLVFCGIHNFVHLTRFPNIKESDDLRVQSHEKCILYSGLLIGDTWENLVVAGGTVFNETVLWVASSGQILHRLKGHDGVIFSIAYNPERSLIVTTSDDRAVRLYSINGPSIKGSMTIDSWKSALIVQSNVFYGHSARVWKCHLLDDCILSVGEDGAMCIWSYNGDPIDKLRAPSHSSLWCLDVLNDKAITGDSASSLLVWDIRAIIEKANKKSREICAPRKIISVISPESATVLVTEIYNEGSKVYQDLLLLDDDSTTTHSLRLDSFKDVCAYNGSDLVAVATREGLITLVTVDPKNGFTIISQRQLVSPIIRIHMLFNSTSMLLLCSHTLRGVKILKNEDLSDDEFFELPKSKHDWCTCAVVTQGGDFVLGDGSGNVHLYKLTELQPVCSIQGLHGIHGVTHMMVKGDSIVTCGRNGRVCLLYCAAGSLVYMRNLWLSAEIQWIARLFLFQDKIMLATFHGSRFILSCLGDERYVETCGGGHRSWSYRLDHSTGLFSFYYVSRGQIFARSTSLSEPALDVINPPSHSRKINAVKNLGLIKGDTYFATAGEDNIINIWKNQRNGEEYSFELVNTLYGHVSSVRAIAVCQGLRTRIMVSVGGRAQMVIWKIYEKLDWSGILIQESCIYVSPMGDKTDTANINWSDNSELWPRFLNVCVEERGKDTFEILAVSSDGILRRYQYSTDPDLGIRGILSVISEISCNTSMTLEVRPHEGSAYWLLHGNGVLELSELGENTLAKLVEHRFDVVVPCMDIIKCASYYKVCVGGDDGLVRILTLDMEKQRTLNELLRIEAHSTQVTQVQFLNEYTVLSVSADQRMSVWQLPKGECLVLKTTVIPDISCFAMLDHDTIVVCGNGFEAFRIF